MVFSIIDLSTAPAADDFSDSVASASAAVSVHTWAAVSFYLHDYLESKDWAYSSLSFRMARASLPLL